MNLDSLIFASDQLYRDLIATLYSKAADYASEEDVLKNFRTVGAALRLFNVDVTKDIGYAFVMLFVKVQRLCNLIFSNKKPKNETIEDSFRDLFGYLLLIYAIYNEDKE